MRNVCVYVCVRACERGSAICILISRVRVPISRTITYNVRSRADRTSICRVYTTSERVEAGRFTGTVRVRTKSKREEPSQTVMLDIYDFVAT